jgi:hypothetical protein
MKPRHQERGGENGEGRRQRGNKTQSYLFEQFGSGAAVGGVFVPYLALFSRMAEAEAGFKAIKDGEIYDPEARQMLGWMPLS